MNIDALEADPRDMPRGIEYHPPLQETPYLCGEECFCHLLRRDVALRAGRMTAPSCLGVARRAKTEACGEAGSCNGDHGFTRRAPYQLEGLHWDELDPVISN